MKSCDYFHPVWDRPWNSKLRKEHGSVVPAINHNNIHLLWSILSQSFALHTSNAETKELNNKLGYEKNVSQPATMLTDSRICQNDLNQNFWNVSLLKLMFTEITCTGDELCTLLKWSLPTVQKPYFLQLDHSEATLSAFAPPWGKLYVLWSIEVVGDGLHMREFTPLHAQTRRIKKHFTPHLTLIHLFNLLHFTTAYCDWCYKSRHLITEI